MIQLNVHRVTDTKVDFDSLQNRGRVFFTIAIKTSQGGITLFFDSVDELNGAIREFKALEEIE